MSDMLKAIKAHAEECYPEEACGIVVGDTYHPAKNISDSPTKSFKIAPEFFADCEELGEIVAVVHSHPDQDARPSQVDKCIAEALGLPYWIQSVRLGKCEGRIGKYVPTGWRLPLVGRQFVHGVHDCWGIVCDYYSRELGIDFEHIEREDDWWYKGGNLYLDNLPRLGFRQVDTPKNGDVVLMQVRSPVPNHAAVYLETGIIASEPDLYPAPGAILHHLYGRDSRRDLFGGQWLEKTVSYWRHESINHA